MLKRKIATIDKQLVVPTVAGTKREPEKVEPEVPMAPKFVKKRDRKMTEKVEVKETVKKPVIGLSFADDEEY
jgi:hypothetical protein